MHQVVLIEQGFAVVDSEGRVLEVFHARHKANRRAQELNG